jgi:membrane protease subunit (stomatin/prohibitin family)
MATVKKQAAKPAAKAIAKKTSRVGAKYVCTDCGLVVTIDQDCGCAVVDLLCCGLPMKKKRAACKK